MSINILKETDITPCGLTRGELRVVQRKPTSKPIYETWLIQGIPDGASSDIYVSEYDLDLVIDYLKGVKATINAHRSKLNVASN